MREHFSSRTRLGFLIHLIVMILVAFVGGRLIAKAVNYSALNILPPTKISKEARMAVSPASATALKGGRFAAQIIVYPGAVDINAVGATVRYSKKLEVISLSREGSFCTLYPEEYVKKEERLVRIGCGTPTPGLTESSGVVGTIILRAKETGYARIEIDQKASSVHANDGKGTNVLSGVSNSILTVIAPEAAIPAPQPPGAVVVSSPTHPDQNLWYSENTATFRWFGPDLDEDIRFATSLSQNPTDTPDPANLEEVHEKSFTKLSDGVWYFHLQAKNSSGFGPATHFRIQVDTTPPELNILSSAQNLTIEENLQIEFSGEDAERFLIKQGNESFSAATSPKTFANFSRGKHTLYIRAIDRAGNITERSVTVYVASQKPIDWLIDWLRRILLDR